MSNFEHKGYDPSTQPYFDSHVEQQKACRNPRDSRSWHHKKSFLHPISFCIGSPWVFCAENRTCRAPEARERDSELNGSDTDLDRAHEYAAKTTESF